jgi:hypothetical protein
MATDFWLDEIASLELARLASGTGEILFRMPYDNNHQLTTVWLRWMDGVGPDWLYRVPSFLAGLVAVPAAMLAASRYGRAEARVAGVLAASWFPLALYSTEARGYAGACATTLAAMGWAGRRDRSLAFAAACVIGLFSHLTFLYIYAALLAAEWVVAPQAPVGERMMRHAAPLCAAAAVVLVHALPLQVMGGPSYSLLGVLAEALGLLWGTPASAAGGLVALAATIGAVAAAGPQLRRSGEWPFYVAAMTIPLLAAVLRPSFLFARYFLLALVSCLPVLACAMVALYKERRTRLVAFGAAFLFAAGQIASAVPFWRYGRGGYRGTATYIAEHDPAARVSSDHDFRNGLTLAHHARDIPGLTYVPRQDVAQGDVGWFIRHRAVRDEPEPPESFPGPRGTTFRRVQVHLHGGPSGLDWYLYRRGDGD